MGACAQAAPITSGWRVTMVYSLVWRAATAPPSAASTLMTPAASLAQVLQSWDAGPRMVRRAVQRVVASCCTMSH